MTRDPIRIDPDGPHGPIPTLVFLPDKAAGPLPLVAVGHGAHMSKDDPIAQLLCRALASVPAAVAIVDCPSHGERRDPSLTDDAWHAHVLNLTGDAAVHEQLTAEWNTVIPAVRDAVPAASGPVAYAGFSMGTMFGLSIVGDLPDVRAAFFAVGGYLRDGREIAPVVNAMITKGIAKLGDREVLMCNMSGDETFPIARAVEVLEAIPGPKRMGVWVGGHEDLPPESMAMAIRFLRRVLKT